MEQEPVYIPANRATKLCESILGWIYNLRQSNKETYILDRVKSYNDRIRHDNKIRGWFGWLGVKPKMYITPEGMEYLVRDELSRDPENHPIVHIYGQYGQVECETKDVLISCKMMDSVMVSGGICRAASHMGVDLSPLRPIPFGFQPNKVVAGK